MEISYITKTSKTLEVAAFKAPEPAVDQLKKADKKRSERESAFDRSKLKGNAVSEHIDSIRNEILIRMNSLRYQIFDIGRLLCEVKLLLPHGDFDSWLENNFDFSKSTVLNCMRVYKGCMGLPELVQYFRPSTLYEICRPRFPRELREALFENAIGLFDIKHRELLEVSMKFKKGEVDVYSPEVQNLLKKRNDQSYYNRYKIELNSLKKVLKEFLNKFESLNSQHMTSPLLNQKDNPKDERYFELESMIETFIGEVDAMIEILRPKA